MQGEKFLASRHHDVEFSAPSITNDYGLNDLLPFRGIRDGAIRLLAEPDYLVAKTIRDARVAAPVKAKAGPEPVKSADPEPVGGLHAQLVFNGTTVSYSGGPGDGRVWTTPQLMYGSPQSSWDYKAVGAVMNPNGTTHCSITMIGRSTGLTAAHCFVNPGVNGVFQGFVSTGAVIFGLQTVNSTSPGGVYYSKYIYPGQYRYFVNDNWVHSSSYDNNWDFAIVDFLHDANGNLTSNYPATRRDGSEHRSAWDPQTTI